MKLFLVVLLIVCVLQLTYVFAWKNRKSFPNECRHKEYGVFKIGQSKLHHKKCAVVICRSTGKLTSLHCNAHAKAEKGCKMRKGDREKPFPDCCPKPSCPNKY
ncbi:la1-like protein 13 [Tribolium madens]|uniref:la1-like protein 13 n=1 Tax=Tribolium madens TaxID=41895 RepID=UPI001CF75AAC|nr:la1-like protein 13 [Tribolium madens]